MFALFCRRGTSSPPFGAGDQAIPQRHGPAVLIEEDVPELLDRDEQGRGAQGQWPVLLREALAAPVLRGDDFPRDVVACIGFLQKRLAGRSGYFAGRPERLAVKGTGSR